MKGVFSTFLLLQPLLNEAMLFVLSLVSEGVGVTCESHCSLDWGFVGGRK